MISIQVPHFFNNHPISAYNSMAHPAFLNGMSAVTRQSNMPMSHPTVSSENKQKNTPGAKRRPSRAGTRSVATLTAAQLERKRANDREAQRAIRQRTKDHIDSLERRITELTSSNDANAKLAQALARLDELEQDNKCLRSRINTCMNALAEGQQITPDMLNGPASPNKRLRIATRSSSVPTASSVPRSVPNSATLPMDQWNQQFSSVSSSVERSPSLADVSPVSTVNMRWGQELGQAMEHSMAQQSPVTYIPMMSEQERALSYSPVTDRMMQPFPTPTLSEHNHHCPPHSGAQLTPTIPSPGYAQFPATPQSYIAQSPHEQDPNLPLLSQQ